MQIMLSDQAKKLWAKSEPYKSLWHHMLDSGCCALALAKEPRFFALVRLAADIFALSLPKARCLLAYMAAIHDCYGKTHPAFQKKDAELQTPFAEMISSLWDRDTNFRHEKYGGLCYTDTLQEKGGAELVARVMGSIIRLHHQGKTGDARPPRLAQAQWQSLREELDAAAQAVFGISPLEITVCRDCSAAVMAISPFVILADWIASSSPFDALSREDDEQYLAVSRKAAFSTVAEYGLHSPSAFPDTKRYTDLWPFLTENALRSLQRTVLHDVRPDAELTIIEAPMGEGKTEAGAFYAARLCNMAGKQGIYFALPTAATSNQMHQRISEMLRHIGMEDARLMHGMAWLVEEGRTAFSSDDGEDAKDADNWLRPMRRALLAENAVGTVDQAMMAAMPIRYGGLRLLGLTGKVLVIDEIHAYDAYMTTIIERLLMWCHALRIPVVMLSATLTMGKRREMLRCCGADVKALSTAYPLITQVKGGEVKETPFEGCAMNRKYRFATLNLWNDPAGVARHALQRVSGGGCLCLMLNTVREAQDVYRALLAENTEHVRLMLFHARFKAGRRDEIERECIRLFGKKTGYRPEKAILVCTQVVEQSLDVDFDGMITAIAPIDLLLQRAGRVHRHDATARPDSFREPVIEVLAPDMADGDRIPAYGGSGAVYEPWILWQTQKLLPRIINIPEDMRAAMDRVYRPPEDIPEEWATMMFGNDRQKAQAAGNMLPAPDRERFFGWDTDEPFSMEDGEEPVCAKTRLGNEAQRIALLPAELYAGFTAKPQDKAVARMVLTHSFTVRGRAEKERVVQAGPLRDVLVLEDTGDPILLNDVRIRYDETLGAIAERGNHDV